jgi:serine kinase of HPr protein (carbohydrate metabolism regulator)
MGKAQEDDAWITIMSNVNVIAVASLSDTACVILSEGVILEEDVLATAKEKGINVLTTEKSTYEAAVILSGLI